MGFDKANKISSMMPDIGCPPLDELLEQNKDIRKLYDSDPEVKEVYDDAIDLSNCIGALGIHACIQPFDFIRTLDGLKYIKDVKVGDKVLTHMGRYRDVTNTIKTHNTELYDLKCRKGFNIGITGNHPVLVVSRYVKTEYTDSTKTKRKATYLFTDPYWKAVQDLNIKKDFVAVNYDLSDGTMPNSEYDLPFENKDLWWLLGLFVADGWNEQVKRNGAKGIRYDRRCFICCEKKIEEVEEISRRLTSCNIPFSLNESRTCYKFYIGGGTFSKYCDIFGSGAKNKLIPSDILNAPIEYQLEFCNGYIWGDGSVEEYGIRANTTSEMLAHGISHLFNRVFSSASTISYIEPREGVIEGRSIKSSAQYRVAINFKEIDNPTGVSSFKVNGKYYSRIDSITKRIGDFDTYNFSVKEDESYVCNNMVVHNCGIALSDRPLWEDVPLWDSKGVPVIQWEGNKIEETAGVVKLDVLGLKTLSLLNFSRRLIKQRHGVDIDWYSLPMDDEKAYKVMWNQRNYGIFQFEEAGMSGFVNACKPKTIHDIAVIVSTYRPRSGAL